MADKELNEIKQKIDIIDLISGYLPLKKAGRNYRGLCPFHNEKTPSFMVSQELQIFKCFGCGEGGDVFSFVQKIEGLDFVGSLRLLAERAGVKLTEQKITPQQSRRERLLQIHSLATEFFHFLLSEHEVGKTALAYLTGRGLTKDNIKKFALGYSPRSWDSLGNFLLKKGYSLSEMLSSGLVVQKEGGRGFYDRFRGRVMFPIRNVGGQTIGFSGRVIDPKDEPKYLNSPETDIFKKSEVLFGIDLAKGAIKKENLAIVVEGQMDMITPFLAGTKNIVACLGTALSWPQLQLLRRFTENVSLSFDTDLAGDTAARRGIELAEEAGLTVRLITLPGQLKDPDECVRKKPEVWRKAVKEAESVYDFLFSSAERKYDLKDPVAKKKFAASLLPVLSGIANEIIRSHYIKKAASLLEVTEEVLIKELLRQKRSGNVPAPKAEVDGGKTPVRTRQEILEETILSLLFLVPLPAAQSAVEALAEADFNGSATRALFSALKKYLLPRKVPIEIKVFYDKIDESLQAALSHLYLLTEKDYSGLSEEGLCKLLAESASVLKQETYKRKLREISTKIKEVEKSGAETDLKKLQEQFKEVSVKLKKYEQT